MLNKIIEFSLTRRTMVLILTALFLIAGLIAFQNLNIEAYPDPSPPMVEIITQSPGHSAEEIERYVTIPIEIAMAGLPGLEDVRSISLYGLSNVRVWFTYETDYYFALQQVLNRLNTVSLPEGVESPEISPVSVLGEIFRYELRGPPGYSLKDLHTLQEWVVRRIFTTVPGVIDVVGWGGLTREYHVEVDLNRLLAHDLSLQELSEAVAESNRNVGARTLNMGEQAANVRGLGLIHSLTDIEDIVLRERNGTPVLLRDVARARIGHAQRLGICGRDDNDDIVQGIVLMRRGERTQEVLERVAAKAEEINQSGLLPDAVYLDPIYDRRSLIDLTTGTVRHNLLFGVVLIFFIQYIFLGDLRSAVIVSVTIPIALFFSAILMILRGDSANLLSIGAIDFGIIVDLTVIMVENVFRHLREGGQRISRIASPTLNTPKLQKIFAGATEVDRAIFFSAAIITVGFLPLFTMRGVEGQIFSPMAATYAYAILGALLATFLVSPALSAILLPEKLREKETLIVRKIRAAYFFLLRLTLNFRPVALGGAVLLLAAAVAVAPMLGTEFLPSLEEGNLWIRATLPPTVSLEAGQDYVSRMREIIGGFPEVITVVSQHGRPDDGTDPAGFSNVELFAPLKPMEKWRAGLTKLQLLEEIQERLEENFVGIDFGFSQYIEDQVHEMVSGVKGENSVKLFGPDLQTLERKAREIETQLNLVEGIEDVGVFTALGQPNLLIEVDREACSRFNLSVGDVNAVVQAAVGGEDVTEVYEEERRFPLILRLMPEYRDSVDAIRSIPVSTPGGARVPLSELSNIRLEPGASFIYREAHERFIPIRFSVRGRDLGGAVAEAQQRIDQEVSPAAGYRTEWAGEFGELEEAKARLAYIVPASILLIVVLLYSMFNSLRDSLLVICCVPFALIGGLLALFFTGSLFSVSAAVGFVTLFGVTTMAGVIFLSYYNDLRKEGRTRLSALLRTAQVRMRPVLMMCLAAGLGLLPAAISTGIGSETQKPLATVVVGGMLPAPILILLVMPVIISYMPEKDGKKPS